MLIRTVVLVAFSFAVALAQEGGSLNEVEKGEISSLSDTSTAAVTEVETKNLEESSPVEVAASAPSPTVQTVQIVEEQKSAPKEEPAVLGVNQPILVQLVVPKEEEKIDPEKYHTHDGFYLSFEVGSGFNATRLHGVKEKGLATAGTFRIGGAVNKNIILYANFSDVALFGDKDGEEILSISMGGLGIDYYFMPSNIFLGVALGGSDVVQGEDDEKIRGKGVGFRTSCGKEWWVSENWALGAALSYMHSRTRYDGDWERSNTIALHFTATFN